MGSWTARYEAGDRVQVWTEMTSAGAELRDDPHRWEDARAVAVLTMARARHNVETLIERLQASGYEFDADEALLPPPRETAAQMDEVEAAVGPLPLALRAWFEQVGQLNLSGSHPSWPADPGDPLVVYAPVDDLLAEHEVHEAGRRFEIDISPDYLRRAPGPYYAIAVPNPAADAPLLWERHQTTFVNYLRIAFAQAGFPQGAPPQVLDWSADLLAL